MLKKQGSGRATSYILTDYAANINPQTSGAKKQNLVQESVALSTNNLENLLHFPKKATSHQIYTAILALCQQQPFAIESLAGILQRNPDYLRKTYINVMINEGLLSHVYDKTPNHPEQAYIITALGQQWLIALDCNETDL